MGAVFPALDYKSRRRSLAGLVVTAVCISLLPQVWPVTVASESYEYCDYHDYYQDIQYVPYTRRSNRAFVTIEVGKAVRADIDFGFTDRYTRPDTDQEISEGHEYDPEDDAYDDYPIPFQMNNDDDDANGIIDSYEITTKSNDNNLIPLELGYWLREDAYINDFEATLVIPWYLQDKMRLWYWDSTFKEIIPSYESYYLNGGYYHTEGMEWPLSELPKQIYLEPLKTTENGSYGGSGSIKLQIRSLNSGQSLGSDRYIPSTSSQTSDTDTIRFDIEDTPQDASLLTGTVIPGLTESPLIRHMQNVQVLKDRVFATRVRVSDEDTDRDELTFEVENVQEIIGEVEYCNSCFIDCKGTINGETCPAGVECLADVDANRIINNYDWIESSCRQCSGDNCKQGCTSCTTECVNVPGVCPTPGDVCVFEEDETTTVCVSCNNNGICEPSANETCASCPADCLGTTTVCGADEVCSVATRGDRAECLFCDNDSICEPGLGESCQCGDCHGNADACFNGQSCNEIRPASGNQQALYACGACGDMKCNENTLVPVKNFERYFRFYQEEYATVEDNNIGLFYFDAESDNDYDVTPEDTQTKRRFLVDIKVTDPEGNADVDQFELTYHNYNWSRPYMYAGMTTRKGSEFGYFEPYRGGHTIYFDYSHDPDYPSPRLWLGLINSLMYDWNYTLQDYVFQPVDFDADRQTRNEDMIIRSNASYVDHGADTKPSTNSKAEGRWTVGFNDVGTAYGTLFEANDRAVNPGSPFRDTARVSYDKLYTEVNYGHGYYEDEPHPRGSVSPQSARDLSFHVQWHPVENPDDPDNNPVYNGQLTYFYPTLKRYDEDENTTTYSPAIYTVSGGPAKALEFTYTNFSYAKQLSDGSWENGEDPYENGNFKYVPRPGYEGLDEFSYSVRSVIGCVNGEFPTDPTLSTPPPDTNFCGDGVVGLAEECDDGKNGAIDSDCTFDCRRKDCSTNDDCAGVCYGGQCYGECSDTAGCPAGQECFFNICRNMCGNGVIDAGEQCDDGQDNSTAFSDCRGNCMLKECQEDSECLDRESCVANECVGGGTSSTASSSDSSMSADSSVSSENSSVTSSVISSSVSSAISSNTSTGSSVSSSEISSSLGGDSSVSSSSSSASSVYQPGAYSCPLY